MRKVALSLSVIGLALPFLAASPTQAQLSRTWVSGVGNDANPCSRTAPCKTFAAAIANTTPGGEINCLDPGSFDTVTITKAITISCEAGTAGILAPNGLIAIIIDAATTDVVNLRGLDIDGQGSGITGILIHGAKAVRIEKCTIRNFRLSVFSAAISTQANSPWTIFLDVVGTAISDNWNGIMLPSGGGNKIASLKNVAITGSMQDGVQVVDTNALANVTDSVISSNGGSAVVTLAPGTTANIERSTIANNGFAGLNAAASGSTIRAADNEIYNNTNGVVVAQGATVQSDGMNKHGNSNGGLQVPNASLAQY